MPARFDRPIAHRGLHARDRGIVENSASAFAAAIAAAFAIECDLQLSADGEAIVFHDDDTRRLLGRSGPLRDLSAAEIATLPLLDSAVPEAPQTFPAMLAQVAGRTPVVAELKDQQDGPRNRRLARRTAELARDYSGPLVLKSFSPTILAELRTAGYAGDLGIITHRYADGGLPDWQRLILRQLLHYPYSRFTFISCEQSALDLPAIRRFRADGMQVMSWTIRSPDQARMALQHADQIVFEGFDPRRP